MKLKRRYQLQILSIFIILYSGCIENRKYSIAPQPNAIELYDQLEITTKQGTKINLSVRKVTERGIYGFNEEFISFKQITKVEKITRGTDPEKGLIALGIIAFFGIKVFLQ